MFKNVLAALCVIVPIWAQAQTDPLEIVTITRPPFSMVEKGQDTGFSVDLWTAIAAELN